MLHNCFTVKGKSGTATALNTLDGNFLNTFMTVGQWAKYILLCDEDGNTVSAPVTLKFVNDNPARGGDMRAVYSASVTVTPNKRFTKVCLASAVSEAKAVSRASISYFAEDEAVEVTAAIFLSVEADEFTALCGGNNPLVRQLLGCGSIPVCFMGSGLLSYPPINNVPTADQITSVVRARFTVENNELALSSLGNTTGTEIFATDAGVPIMRALRPYTRETYMYSGTVDSHCAALLGNNYIDEVLTARIESNYMVRVDCSRVYEKVVKINEDEMVNLGAEGDIKSDPRGEYLLVTTASYAEVYKVVGGRVERLLRVKRQYENTDITIGGSLCMWSSNKLTIYERNDDGEYESATYTVWRGKNSMVFREGFSYHAVTLNDGYVNRYKISDGNAELIESSAVSGKNCFFSKCNNIAVWADTSIHAKMLNADVTQDFTCDQLETELTYSMQGVGDGFAIVCEQETLTYYLFDFVHNKKMQLPAPTKCNGRIMYGQKGYYAYDYYNGAKALQSNVATQGVESACIAGDLLWTLNEGKLYCHCLYGSSMAVRMSKRDIGKKYYCNTLVRKFKGIGKPAKFTLKLI